MQVCVQGMSPTALSEVTTTENDVKMDTVWMSINKGRDKCIQCSDWIENYAAMNENEVDLSALMQRNTYYIWLNLKAI